MSHFLTDDQRQVQDLVRRVAREKVAARADAIDRSAQYPDDMFALLKELGLFTLPFPSKYGGSGNMLAACIAVEELGRVCYNTAYLLVVQWIPFGAILAGGDTAQQDQYLPGLADGTLRAAFSTTEAQSGSDVQGIKTRATPVAGGYRIDGAKIWCTNSHIADFVIVAAKTTEPDGANAISLFIVDRNTPGFTIGRKEDKIGARGIPSSPLFFDNAFVPQENRLGPEGRAGFKAFNEGPKNNREADFLKLRRALAQGTPWTDGLLSDIMPK